MANLSLHRGQKRVFFDRARFRVVVAGRRWGKTHLSRTEMIAAIRRLKLKHGPKERILIWYVAPTYGMARDIMWDEMLEIIPRRWIKKVNETKMTIYLKNKVTFQLKGADKPDSLRGRGVHFIILDEYQDFKAEAWEKVLFPTLTDKGGSALFIGTPKAYNCLYDVYAKGQDKTQREWASWQFPTIMSPFIPESEIKQARANLDLKTFRQEFEASFETMSGRVYYPFERELHVGDYPFDKNCDIYVGQDFNVDPMCSVILQPRPNGELWAVDEIFIRNSNTLEVCDELQKRYWRHSHRTRIFPDPAGANRGSQRGESDLDIFRQANFQAIHYRRKHPPVRDRVNSVNMMLKSADGTVRLRINRKCTNLIASLEQTIYKPGTTDVDKKAGTEHMADALGYPIEFVYPAHRMQYTASNYK